MRAQAVALVAFTALCAAPVMAATPADTKGAESKVAESKIPIGQKVNNFTLRDSRGASQALDAVGKNKIVVLAFLGTECPLAKLYAPRLAELAKKYESKGVVFLGLDANRQDAVTEINAFAKEHNIEFPILKDLNQVVADQVGATRTPEVVVLDADRKIVYRGRIDDQYGFKATMNYQKKAPTVNHLTDALDAVLAKKPVAIAEAAAQGCLIGRDLKPDPKSEVTYSNQIARIMNANCVFCHREGQIAPFTLTNYDEVAGWASMIDEVVEEQRMPPWHADKRYGHFKNDARLSDADKATIKKWVASGAPQGDPKDLPEPPKFAEGWMIPKPEQVVYMADKPFKVPATGVVDYKMFVVDPGWKEDKWVEAVEPRPGNPAVVHHILLFVLPPDGSLNGGIGSGNDYLAAYAPGLRPEPLTPGLARYVPAGSKLIFQMHYTPNGVAQEDRSYCGFIFTDANTVKKEVRVNSAVNFVFQIPPGDGNHEVKSRYIFRDDTLLLTLMPHMHLRGKAFRYEATYPDGRHEVLLDVPKYDFGWQTSYRFSEPKMMPRGTKMDCIAVFDNSEENLNNPNPKEAVRFGDQTFEEMMIGFFEATPAKENRLDPKAAVKPLSRVEQFGVILAATKGEPDDNVKVGAYMAMSDPQIFRQFDHILRTMIPQVDRVCVTAIKDGKVSELMGPSSRGPEDPKAHHKSEHDDEEAALVKEINEARAKAGKELLGAEGVQSPLPTVEAGGDGISEVAKGGKPVAYDDLDKAQGKLLALMAKRGAKSSLHVPAMLDGKPVVINFWSKDANAFPAPAQALLAGVAQILTAPKGQTEQAAK